MQIVPSRGTMTLSPDIAQELLAQPLSPAYPDRNEDKKPSFFHNRRMLFFFISVAILILLGGVGWWFLEGRFWVSTDDAYIRGDISTIAPKVAGYIKNVSVQANHLVKKGDVLFWLDDGDYRIAFDEAQARLATHKHTLLRIKAQIEAARSSLDEAESARAAALAVKTNADLNFDRVKELQEKRVISQSGVDEARSLMEQADANLARATAQMATAQANIIVLQAQYAEAQSTTRSLELACDKAKRDLDFTIMRAPFDGIIGNLSVAKGDLVSAGQRLAALIPVEGLYIEANYKETQLQDIHGSERVHIKIDGIRGQSFEGEVLSLAPASGAVFSLLPPQNATGNFTKVVQRVPVRISIPRKALEGGRVRVGMSVVVSIDTRTRQQNVTLSAR